MELQRGDDLVWQDFLQLFFFILLHPPGCDLLFLLFSLSRADSRNDWRVISWMRLLYQLHFLKSRKWISSSMLNCRTHTHIWSCFLVSCLFMLEWRQNYKNKMRKYPQKNIIIWLVQLIVIFVNIFFILIKIHFKINIIFSPLVDPWLLCLNMLYFLSRKWHKKKVFHTSTWYYSLITVSHRWRKDSPVPVHNSSLQASVKLVPQIYFDSN